MATLEELEKRIQILEDMRAIERLQATYWDCMDTKQWEGVRACFVDDFKFINKTTGNTFVGADGMIKNISTKFAGRVTTSHHGHHHWIEITSDTTAIAHWALEDDLYSPDGGGEFKGRAHYDNKYVKIDGKWYCQEMALTYLRGEGQLKKIAPDCQNAYGVFML